MTNILLIAVFGLQVATQAELGCLGFIHDSELPMNVYISGTEREGTTALAVTGGLVYLSGPGIASLKPGETYYVSRAEGVIRDRLTTEKLGVYYMELGTVRVHTSEGAAARAEIVKSCRPMMKGDIVLPAASRSAVEFSGELSDRFTPFPSEGLASSIILGREDAHEMATGQFCFIGVGARDGVRIGDRFTVYRSQPPFNPGDFLAAGSGSLLSYEKLTPARYPGALIQLLRARKLPPRPLGDIVIVDMAESTSAARIINCREEIHLGDIVVKR